MNTSDSVSLFYYIVICKTDWNWKRPPPKKNVVPGPPQKCGPGPPTVLVRPCSAWLQTSRQTIGYCSKVASVHGSVREHFHSSLPQFWRAAYWEVPRRWLSRRIKHRLRVPWLFLAWLYLLLRTRYGQPCQSTDHARPASAHTRENALSKKPRI